eukprot:UN01593
MIDPSCCGWCCGMFSMLSIIFMYVLVLNIDGSYARLEIEKDDRELAVGNLMGAIYAYGGCVAISVGMIVYSRVRTPTATAEEETP